MSSEPTLIVLDTNILLHFERPDHLGWAEAFTPPIKVVVPVEVISELDRHKRSDKKKLQKRAKKLLRWLEEKDGVEIRDGVTLELAGREPHQFLADHPEFDPAVPDDRIVAFVLQLASEINGETIFVTDDTAPRIKAKKAGLRVAAPREGMRLSEDMTLEDKENARLRAELAAHKTRGPKLSVQFQEEESVLQVGPNLLEGREARIGKEMHLESISLAQCIKPEKDHERDRHLDEYRPFLEHLHSYLELTSRRVLIRLALKNSGTALASNIKVVLTWGATIKFLDQMPDLPKRPYTIINTRTFGIDTLETRIHTLIKHIQLPDDGPPRVEGRQGGVTCSFAPRDLVHGADLKLGQFELVLPSIDDSAGFKIEWEVHCAELASSTCGTLHTQTPNTRSFDELIEEIDPVGH